jgi:BirA family biotin operon repressor/biotin-[acetyl-CoA-carboxylase] ligase
MGTFDVRVFKQLLETVALGRNLIYLPVTTSTMDDARRAAERGCPHGTLILAENQTAGRGRRGRSFHTPDEDNLYFTFVLRASRTMLQSAPLAVPLAVCEAVSAAGLDARIKWPNDIWVGGRKICGMLIDAESTVEGATLYPGIGLNVNGDPTTVPALAHIATSMARELDRTSAREPLLADITNRLERGLDTAFEALLERYREVSVVLGHEIEVLQPGARPFRATALDIDRDGALIVRLASGETRSVIAADVSVRPA